jgi:hypothetical protein
LYGDVILTRDIAEQGLCAGNVGTLVERHVVPDVAEEGYSVELFDMTGNGNEPLKTTPRDPPALSWPRLMRALLVVAGDEGIEARHEDSPAAAFWQRSWFCLRSTGIGKVRGCLSKTAGEFLNRRTLLRTPRNRPIDN